MRENLNSLGWRIANLTDADPDLATVLDGCRDPELTRKLADVVRTHWQRKEMDKPALYDALIRWLDGYRVDESNVEKIAEDLIFALQPIRVNEKTGDSWQAPHTHRQFAKIRDILLDYSDGEVRVRKTLGVVLGDAKKANNELKYISQRVKRTGQPQRVKHAAQKS